VAQDAQKKKLENNFGSQGTYLTGKVAVQLKKSQLTLYPEDVEVVRLFHMMMRR
jgi:hypothetical protein